MRNFKSMLIALLGTVVFLCSTTFFVFADDGGEGIGEYVSESAPHGHGAAIPAGHYGLIAKYADKFLSNPPGPHRTIFAEILMDDIDDPDSADQLHDYFLLDIRKSADFCAGHIPRIVDGYPIDIVNIPFEEVAKPENLAMLPTNTPILVICYTGHTASQINSILNILGYNAWTLRFGMTSWREVSATKVWSPSVSQDIDGGNYPMETCP